MPSSRAQARRRRSFASRATSSIPLVQERDHDQRVEESHDDALWSERLVAGKLLAGIKYVVVKTSTLDADGARLAAAD